MLRRVALGLNILVIATGLGFAFYRLYTTAGFALLAGGLNVLMLRDSQSKKVTFLPIAFNLFLFTAGNLGLIVGIADLLGPPQDGVDPAGQLTRGYALVWMSPVFTIAAVVSAVVFFQRLLRLRRETAA